MGNPLDDLRAITDPVERAKHAQDLVDQLRDDVNEAMTIRKEAIVELGTTKSHAEIAEALGITRARVSQILKEGPPAERLFWGKGPITVALGGKVEAPKDASGKQGPVIAQEDFQGYYALAELLKDLDLAASFEMLPPPGFIRLNRDGLVVICGPRLSPMIGQILESDLHLAFDKDDSGWHVIDRTDNTVYRSPMDTGVSQDYGYLGRLPRPDGRGTFLYIAGIHAIGAPCVIHYLSNYLSEVYREVKTRRFSTLIRGEFDPETLEVLSSERVTPYYRHEQS